VRIAPDTLLNDYFAHARRTGKISFGLIANLAQPGGNVTGLCVDASAEMSAKNLSLLTEIVPGLSRVGVFRQVGYQEPQADVAARRLNVELYVTDVRTIDELESDPAPVSRTSECW